MHVTSLGAAREIQEGIAVDPLLVGCGVKPHDLDSPRPLGRNDSGGKAASKLKCRIPRQQKATVVSGFYHKNQNLSDSA